MKNAKNKGEPNRIKDIQLITSDYQDLYDFKAFISVVKLWQFKPKYWFGKGTETLIKLI